MFRGTSTILVRVFSGGREHGRARQSGINGCRCRVELLCALRREPWPVLGLDVLLVQPAHLLGVPRCRPACHVDGGRLGVFPCGVLAAPPHRATLRAQDPPDCMQHADGRDDAVLPDAWGSRARRPRGGVPVGRGCGPHCLCAGRGVRATFCGAASQWDDSRLSYRLCGFAAAIWAFGVRAARGGCGSGELAACGLRAARYGRRGIGALRWCEPGSAWYRYLVCGPRGPGGARL